jgi:selenocysteine-specific elongation factor
MERSPGLTRVGDRLFSGNDLQQLRMEALNLLDQFHGANPLEEGIDLANLRAQLVANGQLVDHALESILTSGEAELRGALLARRLWRPHLTGSQESLQSALIAQLRGCGSEPPTVATLSEQHGVDVMPLLRILERDGLVVAVEGDRYFAREAVDDLVGRLAAAMGDGKEYSPTDLRDVLGISRKYLIPFLEFCDRRRITERRATGRVLHRR